MKRITRSGPVDQLTGTTAYTVPATETATLGGLWFSVNKVSTTITVSHYVDATGVTTALYSRDLQAFDNFSDDASYVLAENDYILIQSTGAGLTYNCYIDIP